MLSERPSRANSVSVLWFGSTDRRCGAPTLASEIVGRRTSRLTAHAGNAVRKHALSANILEVVDTGPLFFELHMS